MEARPSMRHITESISLSSCELAAHHSCLALLQPQKEERQWFLYPSTNPNTHGRNLARHIKSEIRKTKGDERGRKEARPVGDGGVDNSEAKRVKQSLKPCNAHLRPVLRCPSTSSSSFQGELQHLPFLQAPPFPSHSSHARSAPLHPTPLPGAVLPRPGVKCGESSGLGDG
ncbi:hypothetical protein E2C01_040940 [Portunus trituberculatus]|uniref:Uncharacterized protein n=1 Tax=Portunus trituberculatus TaxID=210409 RepID=A0A5B7FQ47_PORTR|nr:hypothetical protein [Portunus trituberculatus]